MQNENFLVFSFEELPEEVRDATLNGCIGQMKSSLPPKQRDQVTDEMAIERLSSMYWLMYDNEMIEEVSYIPLPGYRMSELSGEGENDEG